MVHQVVQERQEGALFLSSMIRLGPHWRNSNKYSMVLQYCSCSTIWLSLKYTKVAIFKHGLKIQWLTHSFI